MDESIHSDYLMILTKIMTLGAVINTAVSTGESRDDGNTDREGKGIVMVVRVHRTYNENQRVKRSVFEIIRDSGVDTACASLE
ncbi:hypothetical protein C481_16210 [Natrialba asiatica DSM 12278]|uniref:Uncharacterized protein n=1 Tax=Natrialba asiatica (strain ATCC 700177 / DSM 12278 / JCM 9576 / FERM P-10747 / NBRC 102637 / 172P1) TaxID=29540 RepID=M0ALJ0_NATA1|nr:hypothetical protein C481_16210 [Natrialba asiatica DSM 12278]